MTRFPCRAMRQLLCLTLCCLAGGAWLLPVRAQSPSQAPPHNLLVNAGLEQSAQDAPPAWEFWTREPAVGTMRVDTAVHHSGEASLQVVHRGTQDWSAAQTARQAVSPGDILRFSAWVKCDSVSDAQISLVTRTASGDTLNWMAGAVSTRGTHDWQRLERAIVVPSAAATVQFRLTGMGTGTVWLDDGVLVREGTVKAQQARVAAVSLRNQTLSVLVSPDGLLTVRDLRSGGRVWRQQAASADVVVTGVARLKPNTVRLHVWDAANDLHLQADIALPSDAPELTVTLSGDGPQTEPVSFPQPFTAQNGTALVVPLNEGILFPADDASLLPMTLPAYSGHGVCMPWFGVADTRTGAGVLAILGTPDDAQVDIMRPAAGTNLLARAQWQPSRGRFAVPRTVTYAFFTEGGYVAQAKRYRRYAQSAGLFKTLAQKQAANPHVARLLGAVNVWNWDMDKLALCRDMKSLGMTQVLWSSGGTASEVAGINALGFLSSRYDIYQDVWPADAPAYLHHEGWPQDLVWLPNGDWMHGWADTQTLPDGTKKVWQGGVINSERGLARAKTDIPADLKAVPYQCRFLDTTTASPFREDYNPAHPLSRTQDRHNKMALLAFVSGPMRQVLGSETGIDPSVPSVDYYEGMMSFGPYRLPDSGSDMLGYRTPTPEFLKFQVGHFYRVPLWELVYHECIASYWYWGDASNKAPEVWTQRDLFNILYGTPPLFLFDKAGWDKNRARFVQTYKDVCPLVRRLAEDEMLSHTFLTPDHAVQQTRWRSGTRVTVNFGTTDARLPDGTTLKALGWRVDK